MDKTNYSYVGVAFILLVFGVIFIPRIIDRVQSDDIQRHESRTETLSTTASNKVPLSYLTINGERKKVPTFEFTNHKGEIINNDSFENMVYLVEFFFTSCPTICPIMTRNLVSIQNHFPNRQDFGIASFTINPTFDTTEVLRSYAESYGVTNPNWHFLTGNEDEIYDLANTGFNLYAAQVTNAPGGFEHSGNFALIDKQGYIRSRYDAYGNPKIYYNGITSEEEAYDADGETEEISLLKEDILTLLNDENY